MSLPRAVVLAAGRGTRLKDVTGDLPKPLLELHGRPLVEHVLESLRAGGFERFLLVVGYRHELFLERYGGDAAVECVVQEPVNGTGSAALLAREFAAGAPFLLIFGDILADPEDLRGLWGRLLGDARAEVALAVKHVADPHQGAAVYADSDGVVTRIVEKPPLGTSGTNWNSAGIYAFGPGIFGELERLPLSARGEYEITEAIVQVLRRGGRVLMHELRGAWRDVGRPEDVAAALRITSG